MWYLFFEIWLWLLLAFALGWVMSRAVYAKTGGDKNSQSSINQEEG